MKSECRIKKLLRHYEDTIANINKKISFETDQEEIKSLKEDAAVLHIYTAALSWTLSDN